MPDPAASAPLALAPAAFLTIAIPTMRRWAFLKETLPVFLSRPEVAEVIICDETGEDIEQIKQTPLTQDPKLRCIRNEKVLGIYENKRKALSLAKTDWVAILDSDNYFLDEWFEVLVGAIDQTDLTQVYATADFKFVNQKDSTVTTPCSSFSGLTLNRFNWNSTLEFPSANVLLNDGNWVVPRKVLDLLPTSTKSSDVLAADAIYMTWCFVKGGFTIRYVEDLVYLHMIHDESTWLKTAAESSAILRGRDWRL